MGLPPSRRPRYVALPASCRPRQRCTRVSSHTATLNRIHGEHSRCGRNTLPGASMMPSRCEASMMMKYFSGSGARPLPTKTSALILLVPEYQVGTRIALSLAALRVPNVAWARRQLRIVPPSSNSRLPMS